MLVAMAPGDRSGLVTDLAESTSSVYRYQCLGRGTSLIGRSRTLKTTFTFGPIAALPGEFLVF